MKIVKTFALTLFAGLFLMACNQQPQQVATTEPYANNTQVANIAPEEWDYWAKDNLDLQRVGPLIERSRNTQEFETYLNRRDGINNLDLNGDGYVDYLSVDDYQDCNEFECGWSIYDRFGPDQAQEIATVVFYRDEPRYRGARILITGNDNIYGDNYYYETNWLDRTLNLVSYLFAPHTYYRSPYYYDSYPADYVVYDVVDTPVYVSRIEQLYPQPVFVYTTAPTFMEKIKIKSPNNGLHLGQIKARLVKPTKEQAEFRKNNPGKPERVKNNQGGEKQGKQEPPGQAKKDDGRGGNPNKSDNPNKGGNPDRGGGNPNKQDNPNKGGNPDKGAGNPNKGGGKPNKGGNPNKGGGNPNKGGSKGKKP
jgi:hypothetical protein